MVDAGKNRTTLVAGGCFVHHAEAFLMIRGGHLDVSLLGAFEVSEKGDLANGTTEDPALPPGVGGAMDLAVGARAIPGHQQAGRAAYPEDLQLSAYRGRMREAHLHQSRGDRCDTAGIAGG